MMKRFLSVSLLAVIFTCLSVVAQAQNIRLIQTNESGIYKKGQKISVLVLTSNQIRDSLRIRVLKNNNQILIEKTTKILSDSLLVFESSFSEPCSIIIEARIKDGNSTIGL
ncbi:MAG: hypothetical protein ABSF81_12745 [Bacteroidales bacterium]|jgi:vesicle coat complex subunit